jgi:hypothetical protein
MTTKETLVDADRSKAIIRSRYKKQCAQVAFDGTEYHVLLKDMYREFEMITSFHFYWNATHDHPFDYQCEDLYNKHAVKHFAAGYNYPTKRAKP